MASAIDRIALQTYNTKLSSIAEKAILVKQNQPVSVSSDEKMFIDAAAAKGITLAEDTHSRKTLLSWGLIRYIDKTEKNYEVSPLGERLIAAYDEIQGVIPKHRLASIGLDVLCAWRFTDGGRDIHPGEILIRLLLDPELLGYITEHEYTNFLVSPNSKTDGDYNVIKQELLAFRSLGVRAVCPEVERSKTWLFFPGLESHWNLLKNQREFDLEVLPGNQYRWSIASSNAVRMKGAKIKNWQPKVTEFCLTDEAKLAAVNYFKKGKCPMIKNLQVLTYGAPGTGKSHGVDEVAGKLPKKDVVRTTFHPDSDYSTFVGAYKPKMELVPRVAMDGTTVKKATYDAGIDADAKALLEVEKRISYEFVPQAFAKAYVQAWKRMATPGTDGKIAPVMLVIEEINRGDCAKVFGDLFQLLDRRVKDDQQDATKRAGFSEYPVLADSDLADFIRGALTDDEKTAITNAGYGTVVASEHLELMLPPNMYIWATMNTSDQSLFPMDSAFKRRWDWKYTPIKDEGKNWKIQVGGSEYDWWKFLKKVNAEVLHLTSSEDKQLGYFFVKPTDDVIDAEMFVNKVMFFLWNVVFKDCYTECEYLKNGDEHYTFKDFFKDDGTIDEATVKKVLDELFKDSKAGATA